MTQLCNTDGGGGDNQKHKNKTKAEWGGVLLNDVQSERLLPTWFINQRWGAISEEMCGHFEQYHRRWTEFMESYGDRFEEK